ncbi:STAS domain-containing protein [Streptomycetaceae bacterium NBC_01309]
MSRPPSSRIRAPAYPATPTARALEVRTEYSGERAVVHLAGEIDQDNAADLQTAWDGALQAHPRHLHVDARAVSFCDSSGLHALLHARDRSADAGAAFTLDPGDCLAHLLRLTGTTELFPADTAAAPGPTAR